VKTNKLAPIHPGEILRGEFMKPRNLSQNALARALNVPPRRINEIVLEKRGIPSNPGGNEFSEPYQVGFGFRCVRGV
jgi:hypothetical protein